MTAPGSRNARASGPPPGVGCGGRLSTHASHVHRHGSRTAHRAHTAGRTTSKERPHVTDQGTVAERHTPAAHTSGPTPRNSVRNPADNSGQCGQRTLRAPNRAPRPNAHNDLPRWNVRHCPGRYNTRLTCSRMPRSHHGAAIMWPPARTITCPPPPLPHTSRPPPPCGPRSPPNAWQRLAPFLTWRVATAPLATKPMTFSRANSARPPRQPVRPRADAPHRMRLRGFAKPSDGIAAPALGRGLRCTARHAPERPGKPPGPGVVSGPPSRLAPPCGARSGPAESHQVTRRRGAVRQPTHPGLWCHFHDREAPPRSNRGGPWRSSAQRTAYSRQYY